MGGEKQGLFNSSAKTVFLYMAMLNMHWANEHWELLWNLVMRKLNLAAGRPA